MSDKKHIDRIFQERFKDFEATPDDAVWKNIKSRLKEKEDDGRVIPLWWRYAGVAALLLLLLTIGGLMFGGDSDTNSSIQVADSENTIPLNSDERKGSDLIKIPSSSDIDTTQAIVTSTDSNVLEEERQEGVIANTSNKTNNTLKEAVLVSNASSSNNTVAENTSSKQNIKSNSNLNNSFNSEKDDNLVSNSTFKNHTVAEDSSVKQNIQSAETLNNNQTLPNNIESTTDKNTKNLMQLQDSNSEIAKATENSDSLNIENDLNTLDEINSISDNEAEIQNIVAKNDIEKETEQENIKAIDSLTIEGEIANLEDIIEEEKTINRWSISPNVAPVYFNSLGEGSSIDAQFDSNSKSGELNMSYGITGSYAINNKLVVRTGINNVNLGYKTNDILMFETTGRGTNSSLLSNIKTNNSEVQMTLVSAETIVLSRASNVIDLDNVGSLNQRIGYIEIPVELQYSLLNKKFGVNVIGGFSSFFLNENELSSSLNGNTIKIGEANNVNDISYSANFGLGLNYNFSKNFDFNLEPIFKYQINTFSNISGDFKPYFIGFYTGFSFKF